MGLRVIWSESDLATPPQRLSLRQFWEQYYLSEFGHQSPGSLSSDRNALTHWEQCLAKKDRPAGPLLGELFRKGREPVQLRDKLLSDGLSGSTIRKVWRELKAILNYAIELEFIDEIPTPPRRRGFVAASQAMPRELVGDPLITDMYRNISRVTYPDRSARSRDLWRVLLAVDYTYGPRTIDLVNLPREGLLLGERLLRFRAKKVNKLQGLPIPDWLLEILQRWCAGRTGERLFEALRVRGFYDSTRKRWVNGWRTTWRRDINYGIQPQVDFQDIRQAVLTRWRATGVGSFIVGHAERGVSDKHYTQPSELVKDVVNAWVPPAVLREFAAGRHWGE